MWAVYVLVGALMIVGFLGSFLPLLPGTPLILAGALIYAIATDFEVLGTGHLLILTALTLIAHGLDYVAGALGAKKYGGSRFAVVGAILGAIFGFVILGPLGVVLGPILGAIAGEMMRSSNWSASLRTGFGTVVGMVLGTAAKLSIATIMLGLFLLWVYRS